MRKTGPASLIRNRKSLFRAPGRALDAALDAARAGCRLVCLGASDVVMRAAAAKSRRITDDWIFGDGFEAAP
jgi:hypothetical protein